MGRSGRVVAAVIGVLAVVAAFVYAAVPDGHVKDAGRVVGYTPAPQITHPTVLWIGDSYPAGTGATAPSQSEAYLTAKRLGWYIDADVEGGTGFAANGHANSKTFAPLAQRLPADRTSTPHPSVIVIDAGRNDGTNPDTLKPAVDSYFDGVIKQYPQVPVVLVDPYFMQSTTDAFRGLRRLMREEAAERGWRNIDPIGMGWIGPASARLTISDDIHPNPAGHAYLAAHLAPAIQRVEPTVRTVTSHPAA